MITFTAEPTLKRAKVQKHMRPPVEFVSVWVSVREFGLRWPWPPMTNRCFFQFFSQLVFVGMQGWLCSLGFSWKKNAEICWRFFFRKKQFLFSVHASFNKRLNWVVLTTRDDVLSTWKDILSHLDRIKVVRAPAIAVKTLPLLFSWWVSAGILERMLWVQYKSVLFKILIVFINIQN